MLDRYPQFWIDAFDFQGRIRRIDYWMIVLLNLVIASLLSLMSGSIAWVFGVALIVPFFSMQIRRIRDTRGMALDLHQPCALDQTDMAVVDFDRTFR